MAWDLEGGEGRVSRALLRPPSLSFWTFSLTLSDSSRPWHGEVSCQGWGGPWSCPSDVGGPCQADGLHTGGDLGFLGL
jgi:hypothetical protein